MNQTTRQSIPLDDIALELCALSKVYPLKRGLFQPPGQLKAVNDVSLRLYRGETLGLVGESGCGKSTLAKMLLGLLAPTSGNVLINGQEVDPTQRKEHARHIQPIFQDPYSSLNPRKTVGEIVGLPLKLHGIGTAAERARKVKDILDLVGMPERTHAQYPNQLSGGQRQRVAIARALILRPDILICDEPTSALDVSVQAQILNLLLDLKAEFGLTYLFISHDLGVVEHLVDRVAVMNQGSIVELQSREQIFSDPQHPYTRTLLASALTPEPGRGIPVLAAAA
ncbi:ABC transporter ATP-binding protein [Herbaspirillum sp. AP02]|uniref:ATP-binding cassette domain-containing protein n=1 Tax=unclassified Herbaspirillum TaxID=2624150 RepID=UPI0015DB4F7B|nr:MULTISPECIES: ATP-binding cassette domain-containing protein [unclassified Herbaspirillum]MBG7620474.1 ABC transporter ATP-binding protein [Herbaspirillum sp. AP02]NZD67938.1 ABC transporter ATP-binding protein [Herbaspirillum sp. AP21]